MTARTPKRLDDSRRDEHLGAGGIGVLSLSTSRGEPPHTLPVSFGYDSTNEVFYFRLATGPEMSKGEVTDRPASFVTYGETEEGWWSVVARGVLGDVDGSSDSTASLQGLDNVSIPIVDIFGVPPRDVSFEFVRLDPDEFDALEESSTAL